jgi:hypothetical protein
MSSCPLPANPGNNALHLVDNDASIAEGYMFWDEQGPPAERKLTPRPSNVSKGATLSMRVKFVSFANFSTSDPNRHAKWCRLNFEILDDGVTNCNLQTEVGYFDTPNKTGVQLYVNDNGNAPLSSTDLADGQWHTLHFVGYTTNTPDTVYHKIWLDGF